MRQIKASDNKMIALVVSSLVPGLNVPSIRDFGIEADELILDHPHFVAAPPGLSPDVRRLWEDTFAKVFRDPEWSASMDKLGYPISPIVEKEKLDAKMAGTLERMGKYKDILSSLDIIK
jgi:tripartite-type tricarboxylate transporter receptor subunit TctC